MALSFEDSLNQVTSDASAETVANVDNNGENISAMSVETFALTDEWRKPNNANIYMYYNDEYYDNKLSTVNENKDISLADNQINLTQEKNSQYIPFEIPRYYDGFDLSNTELSIYWVNELGNGSSALPVDVYYNSDKIRFAWLIDDDVTRYVGKIKFEIQASGKNSKQLGYLWKTKPSDGLNVLQSLKIDSFIEPDDTWQETFINRLAEKVSAAEAAQVEAIAAANEAKQAAADLQDGIDEEVQKAIGSNYYTKTEVDNKIANVKVDLTGYATEEYVDDALTSYAKTDEVNTSLSAKADKSEIPTVPTNVSAFDNDAGYLTEHQSLDEYAKKSEVPSIEGLASVTYVDTAIADADISGKLEDYYNKTETYNQTEIDEKLANVTVDLTGYAKETYVDGKVAEVSSSVATNTSNISSLGDTVTELQQTLNSIDTSPRLTYDAVYNDKEDPNSGENKFVLYEIQNEGVEGAEIKTPKASFTIVGGSGGGATSTTLKIGYITTSPVVATTNDRVVIKYNFSGVDSDGDKVTEGNATWKVAGNVVANNIAVDGDNSFDVTDYLAIGTQKVNLTIADEAGSLVTKNWTVQKIDVRLESTFNDKLTYPIGNVSFDYTPYGAVEKIVHFVLDGVEIGTVTTASSGIPMAYEIPTQTHGAHLFEVYMTAEINGNTIESNHIVKDIIWYDSSSSVPVIGCIQQEFTAKQYDTTSIVYTVYDPSTESPVVTLAVDDGVVSTLTLDNNTQTWLYKSTDIGVHTLTITCGEIVKTLTANIEKLDIDVEPVTAGLVFDFNPTGMSNNDADRLWSSGDIAMSVSDNFDWVNGGYQIDENGDQYFCIKSGTSAVINYNLFEDDAKRNGKEFKLIFKTTNVENASANFLSCVDGSDAAKIGLEMNVHEAYVHANAGSLYLPYSEEDIIEFEFNINKSTDAIPMVMGYEDGVATRPMIYSDSHNFTQNSPKYIAIGSEYCDVFVYRLKVYNAQLTDRGILSNFIADARNAEEMIARYNRNQIYDENQQLTPEILAEKCPQLRIIKIEAPHFTNNKSDKVIGTTIQCIYKNGDPIKDNWTAYNCMHSGQGTTSNEYGAAGRNLDLIMNKSGVDGVSPIIKLSDGKEVSKVSLTRDSVEVAYFNVKVNIASSENANNALLQKRYNAYNPYVRPAKQNDSKVKDTMEFHNCVVFIKENDTDITTHREFQDNDWHFYGIGNIGDSKKSDSTRLNDPDDPLECIVEIMDNTFPNSTFPSDAEGLANLELDPFDESMTYGWRYEPTDTQGCIDAWKEFYKFVVQSTDEEFKANLGNYFVIDSALYFYLYTTVFTMIDNRAKNTFWHYGKTGEVDSEGNTIRKWDLCFDYDNDTALGINNSGELTMTYGYEDTDYKTKGDASTGYAFNAATSTFFCRIRDLFVDELRDMYVDRESAGAWSAEGLINQFDEWQSEFPEELWRLDIERKYLRPYRDGNTRFLNQMANGRKKYQRRQFMRNQEKYMASKFFGNVAVSDQIMFRCNTPTDSNLVVKPDYTLHLTPYADMYIDVLFGSTYRTQVRAEAGKQYDIECPFTTMDDTAVLVYCSSLIQSMGDISACYIHDNDFSKASKLKELIIGNATEGYQNSFLTNLGIGNNTLLEKLDIQNTPNLAQSLSLANCGNLRELYAYGSGLTGVIFADGGMIRIAELPAIGALTMKNLAYLTNFDVASFDNLNTLVVENCGTIDLQSIFEQATNLNRVRIVGIDWTLSDTSLLEGIYGMYGIDKNGYNTTQSVLTGKVHVPVIKQQQLYDYQEAWSDLEVTFDTMIEQFAVTFVNEDGTVLDVQYVDKGSSAVDPITRDVNPIAIPVKESTVSTDYTYAGWDSSFESVFAPRTITATYTESTRSYTIKYVSKGITMQESTGLYGENVVYDGVTPTYTLEESAYKYYLFNRWDKSGFIDGDKTVNAIFDSFEYKSGVFDNRELKDLSPVEIYALTRLTEPIDKELSDFGMDVTTGDEYSFTMGYDIDYDDIESNEIIKEKTLYDGSTYLDTGIKLFDTDKDFVLALDYKMSSSNESGATLMQCFQTSGSNGFKLSYDSTAKIIWGSSSTTTVSAGTRDMLVIRHKKGDNNLYIYSSSLKYESFATYTIEKTTATQSDNATLVFGASKMDSGRFANYCSGEVNWCKIWYKDLGERACEKLVGWTHENIALQVDGFYRYQLYDDTTKESMMSLLATHLLEIPMRFNSGGSNTNAGGWAESSLNKVLNTRFYNAIPYQMQALIKKASVSSTAGNKSTETTSSGCYVNIPAIYDLDNSFTGAYRSEVYDTNGTINFMINNDARKRSYVDGNYARYWTRSPNIDYTYMYTIDSDGSHYGFSLPYNEYGVLIEISF